MYSNTIFNQLQNFFSRHEFDNIVSSHRGDKYVKKFTCWQQFNTMLYSQATGKDSLRDVVTGLSVHKTKWYNVGFTNITKSNLSHANK